MLLLLLVNFVSEIRLELMYISVIVSIRPHSSPWFSAACAAAIVHSNHFSRLYQQNRSSESKSNSVLNKGKSAIPLLFNDAEVLFSASD